jgi:opacity protein-like surface antigen
LTRSDAPSVEPGSGVAFQVNYGRRLLSGDRVALYGETNFLASPLRDVSSSTTSATQDFASLYLTPGIRVKFMPASRVSPYVVVGGGYADYEQSRKRIDGTPSSVSRELARGVFDFGAGVDVRVWRFVALRGEARDFYTGSPAYNIAAISGGQHNVVATGAVVLQWH